MNNTARGFAYRKEVIAFFFLVLLAGTTSVAAQRGIPPQDPLNRPGDPLSRDPRRPDMNDREKRTAGAEANLKIEVETALKEAKAAFESKPPRYAEAEASYLRAAHANPKESQAYMGLGYVYAAQDRADDAIKAFQKAIEVKPKLGAAHFNLGMIYSALARKDEALKEYEVLKGLDKTLADRLKQAMEQH